MEVVAVSCAEPKWHTIHGKREYTSIIHEPLTSKEDYINVTVRDGVNENKPAAHNAQIYAYFAEHYDYWTEILDVDREQWGWCHWGENITFRSDESQILAEKDFNLGDIWHVGKTALLQVCGSRVPCHKLSWRCGQKDKWIKELADTGLCGVYFKVLKEGRIHPGDRATLLEKVPTSLDCATITKLAFDASVKTKDTLNILLADPNLLYMNRAIFQRKLSSMHDQLILGKNSWKGWRSFRLSKILSDTNDVKSFYLTPTDGRPLATYVPGQFLTVRLPSGIVRSWSISDWTTHDDPKYYRLSIKRALPQPNAPSGSAWMHDECTEDSILQVRFPAGAFTLDWTPMFPGRQIYISAGIGITPVLAMLKAHLTHPAMKITPAIWIHTSRNGKSHTFQKEIEDLLRDADPEAANMIKMVTTFSSPGAEDQLGQHYQHNGRITEQLLRDLILPPYFVDPVKITPIEIEGQFSTVYICGSTHFEAEMKTHLQSIGVPEFMIRSESFSPGATIEETFISKSYITFSESQCSTVWRNRAADDKDKDGSPARVLTMLEAAELAGLTPEYGCRAGTCGACTTRLKSGQVSGGMEPNGDVKICVAVPASAKIEIEI